MPFTKQVTIPTGHTSNFFTFTAAHVNDETREASFILKVYKDEAAHKARLPGVEAGSVKFTGDAFDLYFAAAVLKQHPYDAAHRAMAAFTAAKKTQAALKENLKAPPLTADQLKLIGLTQARIGAAYGGEMAFDGVTTLS